MLRPPPFAAYLLLLGTAVCTSGARASAPGFAITEAQVATAMAAAGLATPAVRVQMPGPLFATVPEPALQLTSAELLADGRLRARLACKQRRECVAFFVDLTLAERAPAVAQLAALTAGLQSGQRSEGSPRIVSVHVGQRTTLLLEDERMRISLPVTAVDSGSTGSEIRVQTLDHKQIFQAVVTEAGCVKGNLP